MPYGNPDPALPIKFIKGLITPPDAIFSPAGGARIYAKLLFEYWGFCVNGTDDLHTPGGFADISGTQFPTGFISGSGTLVAAGNDGNTEFGTNIFTSNAVNFTALDTLDGTSGGRIEGKYLVTWKPGSDSPDDSVYRIIGIKDSRAIIVDVATGGTTRLGGKAYFSDRSNVKFRIIDLVATVNNLTWNPINTPVAFASHSLVLNFQAAPRVNLGQQVSQLRLSLLTSQSIVRVVASPSGTWNGSSFTDATGSVQQTWFSAGGSSGQGKFIFIGGQDFLITHVNGVDSAWGATTTQPGLHVEVPRRLYPQENDPNPFTWLMWTSTANIAALTFSPESYVNGFRMICHDNVERPWIAMPRVPTAQGDRVHFTITPVSGGVWHGFAHQDSYSRVHHNILSGTMMTSDAVLMQSGTLAHQQYAMSRVRLRRVRFTARNTRAWMRLGEKWLHIGGGVLWPWDGSQLPFGIFWEDGGILGEYTGA